MIVDANILLHAESSSSPFHTAAEAWLTEALNGDLRIGLPWQSLTAFLRIRTNPRAFRHPLSAEQAWRRVQGWLDAPTAWVPVPGDAHHEVLGALVRRHHVTADLISDAHLAALALEHGVAVCSADTDFARFPEVTWLNPLQQ